MGSPTATTTAPRAIVPAGRPAQRTPPEGLLISAVIDEFIVAAEAGRAHNRSGRSYRPGALRDVRGILKHRIAPEVGHVPMRDLRSRDLQAIVDRLAAEGLSQSRIRSVVSAIRALYAYGIERGYVDLSPVTGLVIPSAAPGGRKEKAEEGASDDLDDPWSRDPITQGGLPPQSPADERDDYQPILLVTERILSLVLRIAVVVFVVFALVTIGGSA